MASTNNLTVPFLSIPKRKARNDAAVVDDLAPSWRRDEFNRMKRSRNRNRVFGAIGLTLSLLSVAGWLAFLPLKETSPFLVEHDKTTGQTQLIQPLASHEPINAAEITTLSNINNYVLWRETIDHADLQRRSDKLAKHSASDVYELYERYISLNNNNSPYKVVGLNDVGEVEVVSISLLNNRTAEVRYYIAYRFGNKRNAPIQKQNYVAIVKFKYTPEDMTLAHRLDNALGFIVTGWRRDRETL